MSHHAIQVALYAYFALAGLVYIAYIGRPRKPITPTDAVIQVIGCGLLIWAVWSL